MVRIVLLTLASICSFSCVAHPEPGAASPIAPDTSTLVHTKHPQLRPFSEEMLSRLTVPAGFTVNVFASDLKNIRMMAVAPDGALLVTRRQQGDVLRLVDTNGDGRADDIKTILKLPQAHGITIHDGRLYIATIRQVYVADLKPGGAIGELKLLISDLPDGGQHPNRTLAFGPDAKLYITVGSTCNACVDSNPESATVLRSEPDGRARKVFARGLRNTIGFGWHPVTRQMWGMDHGIDDLGDDLPPEELNHLIEGKNYGWPFVWGNRQVNEPFDHPEVVPDRKAYAALTEPPVLMYQAHSSPLMMVFYTGAQFPPGYRNDAFVAFRGSWNRSPPTGYKVARIRFDSSGNPIAFEDFLTGFLIENGAAQFGRPVGLAVAKDGSLLVGDDTNGVIYRVSYQGPE